MTYTWAFLKTTLVGGLLVFVPIYLAVLLLLKAMGSVVGLVRPFSRLLPDWVPADNLLSAPRAECLLPHRSWHPHPGWASDAGADRDISLRTNPRLRTLSKPDPTTCRRESRECVEAGAGRNRGRTRPRIHHRGVGGRAVHRLRPLDSHAPGWRRVCPQPGTRASLGRPLHAGYPDRLSVGVRGKGPGCRDASKVTIARRVSCRVRRAAAAPDGGARQGRHEQEQTRLEDRVTVCLKSRSA